MNLNARDDDGNTPLLYAMKHANIRWVPLIVSIGADIQTPDYMGVTPLIYSAMRSERTWMSFFIGSHANVDVQDRFGKSALHYAVETDNVVGVTVLLNYDANPNLWDRNGTTPLMLAARNSWVTQILLLNGASPQARNNQGQTALHFAAKGGDILTVQQLLLYRAFAGSKDDFDKLPVDYATEAGFSNVAAALTQELSAHPVPADPLIMARP